MSKSATRTYVRCASILLVLLMLLSLVPFQAFATGTATDSNVATYTLTGTFEGQFDLSSKDYKLFHLTDILPGDQWKGKINIENKANGRMTVCLLTITSNIKNMELFNALDLDISYKGKSIYSGAYNTGRTQITDDYVLEPNETLTLDVVVTLPVSTGNEVQSKIMDSTWTFEANFTEKPQTGVDLMTENTMNIYAAWLVFFAVIGAGVITVRIRATMKAQKEQSEEVDER